MKSKTTRKFRELLALLPSEIRERANEAYKRFCIDPSHASLRFKKVHSIEPVYSARITQDFRVVGVVEGDIIIWFWVGSHADYEKLLKNL